MSSFIKPSTTRFASQRTSTCICKSGRCSVVWYLGKAVYVNVHILIRNLYTEDSQNIKVGRSENIINTYIYTGTQWSAVEFCCHRRLRVDSLSLQSLWWSLLWCRKRPQSTRRQSLHQFPLALQLWGGGDNGNMVFIKLFIHICAYSWQTSMRVWAVPFNAELPFEVVHDVFILP